MSNGHIVATADLPGVYGAVRERIHEAAERSGRSGEDVALIAVTKYASAEQIRALLELGHADLGEGRVQQLVQRAGQAEEFLARRRAMGGGGDRGVEALPERVRWHMVGHLQRNKVKQVVPLVDLIHSLDSLRLAEELHSLGNREDRVIDVLIQVNTSGEGTKNGIAPPAVLHLAQELDLMMHLRLRGLMTIAPYADDPETVRPVFRRTTELFHELRDADFATDHINILSMGMSGDFEVAIEEGANVVRVGSAMFGDVES